MTINGWVGFVLLIAAGLFGQAGRAAADQADPQWKQYENGRFGYSICYPAALLAPQGEADNGDGQWFVAKDGAKAAVYGSNNAMEWSLDHYAAEILKPADGGSRTATYKAGKGNWRVLSGSEGAKTFYTKIVADDDQFFVFDITYDRSAAATYDPIVGRMSRCFRSPAERLQ